MGSRPCQCSHGHLHRVSAFGVERLENEYKNAVAWLHIRFDETAFDALWAEGCAMDMSQAIAYAFEQD